MSAAIGAGSETRQDCVTKIAPRAGVAWIVAVMVGSAGAAMPTAQAAEPAGAAVLTPEVGPQLEAAFAAAAPRFRLDDAQISPREVRARVCRADGSCFALRLAPPDGTCPGRATPAWCVVFPEGEPADAPALLAVLPGGGAASGAPPIAEALSHGMQRAAVWGLPTWAWLLIYGLGPLLAGLLLATAVRLRLRPRPNLRERRRLSRGTVLATLLLAVPVGAQLALWSGRVGGLDGAALLTLTAAVWLLAVDARFARPGRIVLVAAAVAIGAIAAEGIVRLGPAPPAVEHAERSLLLPPSLRPDGLPVAHTEAQLRCALYAPIGEETARCMRLEAPPAEAPWVLHLGDSMAFGTGVPATAALPAVLTAHTPGVSHRNAAVPGVSIDVQLAVLRRVLAVRRPTRVVLHAMPGNDPEEVDQPTELCENQPTMQWRGELASLRCPAPRWAARPWLARVLHSPLPLPLAALQGSSWLARHLAALQRRLIESGRSFRPEPIADAGAYAGYLHALQTTLAAAAVPLDVTLMPLRRSAYEDSAEPRRARMLEVFRAAGLAVWDTQPLVDAWVAAEGEGVVFLDATPGDIHLSAEGHRRLAEALAARLQSAR